MRVAGLNPKNKMNLWTGIMSITKESYVKGAKI